MGYKKQQWELGPNPDISKYEDICTKYGWFRRKIRKRGSKLNYVMGSFRSTTKVSSPAAKRLIDKLSPWTDAFALGWVKATVSGRLAKSYVESGRMTFAYMKDVDINQNYPLNTLFKSGYESKVVNGEVIVKVHVGNHSIELLKSLFTGFYLEAILVWGDPMKPNGLRVDSDESKVYQRGKVKAETCVLWLTLPTKKQPWMVLLKVSCVQSEGIPLTARHFGMKVVEVGGNVE